MSTDRISGVVRWFNAQKGYGFIEGEFGQDVFVHYRNIDTHKSGFKDLGEGEVVEYRPVKTANGMAAAEVIRLSAPEEQDYDDTDLHSLDINERNALYNLARRMRPADIRKLSSNEDEEYFMQSAINKLKTIFHDMHINQ